MRHRRARLEQQRQALVEPPAGRALWPRLSVRCIAGFSRGWASYAVFKNGQQVATVPAGGETSTFVASGLQPNVPAVFSVVPLAPSGSPSGPASVQVPVTPSSGLGAGSPGSGAGAGSPAAPSNLQLTSVSSGLMGGTSATLSWSPPATGAPQSYQVLKDGVPVGSVSGSKTSTTVSDLPRGGVATLSVVPVGPGGAAGPASAPLAAGIPSNPASELVLTAAPASSNSARLSWSRPRGAPSGPGSPASYAVLKNGQQVATVPAGGETSTFVASGLQPNVPAVFSVVPLAPSGSPSGPASVQVPVTPSSGLGAGSPGSGAGAGSPAAPSNLQLTSVSSGLMGGTSATLSWSPPATGAPQSYQVLKDGVPVGSVSGSRTSTTVSDLPRGGVATLSVVPVGPGGAAGPASAPLAAGIPSDPASELVLTAAPASSNSARLSWSRPRGAPSGPGSPASYAVLKNGQQVATVPAGGETSTFVASGLQPNVPAVFSVVPLAPSGSPSGPASVQVPVTPSSGLGAGSPGSGAGAGSPAAPSNLQLTSVSSGLMGGTSATLSWSPPATSAPQSYQVLKDGVPVGSVSGSKTSTTVSDLPRGGVVTLSVVPVGPGGAAGPASAPLAAGIPSDPASELVLTAAPASSNSARLSWSRPRGAPSGPGSPASYAVLKNGQQVATVPAGGETSTFVASGLQPNVPAVFSVVPLAPSGSPSGPASVQPRRPSNLQLTSVSSGLMGGTSATLSWSPPATGTPQSYQVLKDGVPVGSVSGSRTSTTVSDLPRGGVATLSVVPVGPGGAAGPASAPLAAGIPSDPASELVLTAAPASSNSARLSWSRPRARPLAPALRALHCWASYAVLKNGQQVATVPAGGETSTFVASGLQPNVPAVFSVVPLAPSGSPSGPASVQVPVTPSSGLGAGSPGSGAGAGSPAAPSNLQLTSVSSGLMGGTSATLSWSPPATGAPQSYQVLKDGVPVGSVSGSRTSTTVSDLPRGGVATLSVVPVGPGGAAGPASAPLAAGIPSDPASELVLTAAPASSNSARLSWSRPRGAPSGPALRALHCWASYAVLKNGQQVATVPAGGETSTFVASGLQPNVPAVFSVVPLAPSGSPSGPASVQVPVTPSSGLGAGSPGSGTGAAAPSQQAPSNLQLTSVSAGILGNTSATLSWGPPASGAPASYQVLQDGKVVATVPGGQTATNVGGLPSDGVSATTFQVVPLNAKGAAGPASFPLSAGAASSLDSGISLTAAPASTSGTSATLSWNSPSGPAAANVSSFAVMLNGQQIGTVPATGAANNSFVAAGLQPGAPAVFSVVPLSPSGSPSGAASNSIPLSGSSSSPSFGSAFNGDGASAAPDEQAPSNLSLTSSPTATSGRGASSGRLSWKHPSAGPPAMYAVTKDGRVIGTVPGSQTSFNIPAEPPRPSSPGAPMDGSGSGAASKYVVVPMSSQGAAGTPSFPLVASPAQPKNGGLSLTAAPIVPDASAAELTWDAPAKAQEISGYAIMVNGQHAAVVPPSASGKNLYTATGLPPGAVVEVVPMQSAATSPGSRSAAGPKPAPSGASLALPLLSTGRGASTYSATTVATASGAPSTGAPADLELKDLDSPPFGNTTGTLAWKHPAAGAPASYTVMQGGMPVATVPGTQTSCKLENLPSGQAVSLQVIPMSAGGAPGPASHSLNAVCIPCMLAAMLQGK
eukprot:tig00021015_g17146.t1